MSGDDFDRRFDVVADTRRRWSVSEKRKIVAEACVPCANVSAVARQHGLKPALLYRWKKELGDTEQGAGNPATFVPVTLSTCASGISDDAVHPSPSSVLTARDDRIEIRLANGRCVLVDTNFDTTALKRIITALEH